METLPIITEDATRVLPATKSDTALASVAHSRINVPLNLGNWRELPEDTAEQLAWFHQHALEEGLNWKQCVNALNYSQSTIFRVLKGTYEGDWGKVVEQIRGYRAIVAERHAIRNAAFRETRITKLVTGGLEYQYEQVLGRIGMPVQLPREFEWADVEPIVSQYVKGIPAPLRKELVKISNDPGRLGILCETLKFASRIASKQKQEISAESIQTAIATRRQMMGETQYAKK